MYVINLNIYIYRRANGTYISQKIAICSFWTVCPCFNPTPTAGWVNLALYFLYLQTQLLEMYENV